MKRNPYFAQKPRACITQAHEVSMALLKLCIRNCMQSGGRVVYRGKIEMYHFNDCIQIARPTEPADVIEIDPNRIEDAVNLFVDGLVAETTFDPDEFILSIDPEMGGVSWRRIRQIHAFRALIEPENVDFESFIHPPSAESDFDLLHSGAEEGD